MYVALTRARRRLYLSFAQSRMLHGQARYGIASRFIQEIPERLMRRITSSSMFNVQTSKLAQQHPGPGTRNLEPGTRNFEPAAQWRVGQSVMHPTFGTGVIVSAEGRGADARVQVNFRNAGLKWLMLEYARLAPA